MGATSFAAHDDDVDLGSGGDAVDDDNGGVDDHRLESIARYGFVAKGFVYAVIGLLAGRMAFGGAGEQASKSGALDAIAKQPFGKLLLVATAIGLFAYAGYRLILVYTGPDHDTSMPGWFARLSYLIRGVIYAGFGVIALTKLLGSGGSGSGSRDGGVKVTKAVLDMPGGTWLVGAVGVVVIAVGIRQLVRAYKTSWQDKMKSMGMEAGEHRVTQWLGQLGYTGRGIVYGLVGWFVLQSALTYDPEKSGGLDVALREVREASYGSFLLTGIAILLVAYGLFSVQEGRHRKF